MRIACDQFRHAVVSPLLRLNFCVDAEKLGIPEGNSMIDMGLTCSPDTEMIIFVIHLVLQDSDVFCSVCEESGGRHVAAAEFVVEDSAQIGGSQLFESGELVIQQDKRKSRIASRQFQRKGKIFDRDQNHAENPFPLFQLNGQLIRSMFSRDDQQIGLRGLLRASPQTGVERGVHQIDFGVMMGGEKKNGSGLRRIRPPIGGGDKGSLFGSPEAVAIANELIQSLRNGNGADVEGLGQQVHSGKFFLGRTFPRENLFQEDLINLPMERFCAVPGKGRKRGKVHFRIDYYDFY